MTQPTEPWPRDPALPPLPADQRGEGELSLRYHELSRDGRPSLLSLSYAMGVSTWQALHRHSLFAHLRQERILPVLSRLRIRAGGGPISLWPALDVGGDFRLFPAVDEAGQGRLRLDMRCSIHGKIGRLNMPPPPDRGEMVCVGWALAEHVLTRPFSPRAERKVESLPPGLIGLDPGEPWSPPEVASGLPEGASAIEEAWSFDPAPLVFGLGHTDSNQHVNSLVYPRALEEAALRRFASLGLPTRLYACAMDLAYRKPAFEGETLHLALRAFRGARDELGVVAEFRASTEAAGVTAGEPAHCYGSLLFRS